MRNNKIFRNLALSIISISIVFVAFVAKRQGKELLLGYIDDSKKDARRVYIDTQVDSFDPNPEWNPNEKYGTHNQPEIVGYAGILVEIDSGKILVEKNSTEKRKVASLSKIMTAVIALEHKNTNEKIYVSKGAASIGENSMGIDHGEVYSLEELLYGLILHSGNDAAYAIAESVAGNPNRFVEWMNIKAKELGLNNTHFADPSGLDDSTFSTPADLVKLTRYALKNPKFREIVKTVEYETPGNRNHKYIYLYNQTNLLTTYPGVGGVKTGYTEEAGLCLVTYATTGGKEVIGVILNSVNRKGDMIKMLDHGFSTLRVHVKHDLL